MKTTEEVYQEVWDKYDGTTLPSSIIKDAMKLYAEQFIDEAVRVAKLVHNPRMDSYESQYWVDTEAIRALKDQLK